MATIDQQVTGADLVRSEGCSGFDDHEAPC